MSFTVNNMPDLTKILVEHPEWLAEVRRLVLTEDLLALPELVQSLAASHERALQRLTQFEATSLAAHQRADQRLTRIENDIKELTAAQQHTDQKIAELITAQQHTDQKIAELITAQQHTDQKIAELITAQLRTDQQIADLALVQKQVEQRLDHIDDRLKTVEVHLSSLRGSNLQQTYAQHASGYFGKRLRRVQVLHPGRLDADLEDLLYSNLTHDEVLEILRSDIILKGQPQNFQKRLELYLAVEISMTVDEGDIERAQRRAELLRKAGLQAIPVVAGETIHERLNKNIDEIAAKTPIVVFQDGRSWGWEETTALFLEGSEGS